MKECTKCKETKPLTEYYKGKNYKGGYRSQCKVCLKEVKDIYFEKNKDKLKEAKKLWSENNKERIKKTNEIYRKNNKDKLRKTQKKYYKTNRGKILKQSKKYREENKELINNKYKEYYKENKEKLNKLSRIHREQNKKYFSNYMSSWIKKRYSEDQMFRLKTNLRSRIYEYLKKGGYKKTKKTRDILGCSIYFYKKHLQKQFKEGMSWDNHGEWHIDHIIPLASANTEEELINLFYYTNTQPLWAEENIKKSDKIL